MIRQIGKGFQGENLSWVWRGKRVCMRSFLAVSNRKCGSCCLLAELSSLQIPPRSSSIIKDLYHHKLGKATWPSLQQVRCFLSEVLKGFQLLQALTRLRRKKKQKKKPIGSADCQNGQVSWLWCLAYRTLSQGEKGLPCKYPGWNASCLPVSRISSRTLQIFHAQD